MGRKLDLNPGRMLKRSAQRVSKVATVPMGALERRLNPPKPATGVRGRAGGTQDQKHIRAERAMRERAAEHEYFRKNPSKMRMNPKVRLDTSQVEDRRLKGQPSETPMVSHYEGRFLGNDEPEDSPFRARPVAKKNAPSQSAMQRRLYGKKAKN